MKDFLIIGNLNAVAYKVVFPMIKEGKVRLGVSTYSGDSEFEVPDDYPLEAAGSHVSADGRKFIRVNVRWYTTLAHGHINPPLALAATYTPEAYPRYDNCDVINVDKTKDIPCDYYGVMGVPISFLDKWCPEQFEIVGVNCDPEVGGARKYKRLIIRRTGACARASSLAGGRPIDEY